MSLYLASRFELCGKYFSKLGDVQEERYSEMEYLKFCADLHEKTIQLHALCRNTFEPVVALELSSLVIVLGFEMIIILVNPFNSLYSLCISSITEAFVYCVCGELVTTKAAEVTTKIYDSNWYNINDIKTKKALIFIMLRSQQSFDFDVMNYTLASMETFGNVIWIVL